MPRNPGDFEISKDVELINQIALGRPKTILIIDDCVDIIELNRMILELEGYEVLSALSGSEGLSIIDKGSRIDLILLDMRMGDMSGLEFLHELELARPEIIADVPLVFYTAMDNIPSSRAAGVIHKPIGVQDFLQAVQQYMAPAIERTEH